MLQWTLSALIVLFLSSPAIARELTCMPTDLGRATEPVSSLHITNTLTLSPDELKLLEVDTRGSTLTPEYRINQIKRASDIIEISGLYTAGSSLICAGGCAQTFFILQIQTASHATDDNGAQLTNSHFALVTMTQRHFDEELGMVLQRMEPTRMRCVVAGF